MKDLKLCPYLPQKKEIIAMTVGMGDQTITFFHPCIRDRCACFHTTDRGEVCGYMGANIPIWRESEEEKSVSIERSRRRKPDGGN